MPYRLSGLLSGFFGMYGVIVNLGTNDWGQSLITRNAFGSAYGAFLDGIPPSLKVACMSPTWTSTEARLNQEGFTRADFRQTIKEVCAARNRPLHRWSGCDPQFACLLRRVRLLSPERQEGTG